MLRSWTKSSSSTKNGARSGGDATEMIKSTDDNKQLTEAKAAEVKDALAAINARLEIIGNLVHDSVPVSNDEANNQVIRTWSERRTEPNLRNHVDLVELLGIASMKKGSNVVGGRGYYLTGAGMLLNQALINFGLSFLYEKGYEPCSLHFFIRQDIMAKCAQLAQFDEELYKGENLLGSLGCIFSKTWKPKKNRTITGPRITKDDPAYRNGNHQEQREKLGLASTAQGR